MLMLGVRIFLIACFSFINFKSIAEEFSFLRLEIGSEEPDYLKIIFNLGVEKKDYVRQITLDPNAGIKTFYFEFNSRISNVRFLWHHKNVIKFRSLEIGYKQDTIHWKSEDILSYFIINWFITEKFFNNEIVFLRNNPPQGDMYPFMLLNKPGNDLLKFIFEGIDYNESFIELESNFSSPVMIEVYTSTVHNENQPRQFSGVKFIRDRKKIETYVIPILTKDDYESFLLIIRSEKKTKSQLKEIVLRKNQFQRIWRSNNIKSYYAIFSYEKEDKYTANYLEYTFNDHLDILLKDKLISYSEEITKKILTGLFIIISAAIFFSMNKFSLNKLNELLP